MTKKTKAHPIKATDACTCLKGVGSALAAKLAVLGIHCIGDLLLHRPLRYEDRTHVTPLSAVMPQSQALLVVRVEAAELRYGRRRSLLISASDGTARLWIRFFHFSFTQQQQFIAGAWVRLFGEVRYGRYGLEMVHPEYQVVENQDQGYNITPQLLPVYPTTAGLGQNRLRKIADQALEQLKNPSFWPELLPDAWQQNWRGLTAAQAIFEIHRPHKETPLNDLVAGQHPAVARLAFEELLGHQLALRTKRQQVKSHRAPVFINQDITALLPQFGFTPTGAQTRVIKQVLADMAGQEPMLRLVQGDVGSGKTVVAAAACYATVQNAWQAVFMAPTELLAQQHYKTIEQWLAPLEIPVWLLTGKTTLEQAQRQAIEAGQPGVLIGTHALFQDAVNIGRLGLCIIDEQHRFGVAQRLALREKSDASGVIAHQLVMTATPIPRTLAMSAYADLDTSIIDEMPPGRMPVKTVAIPDSRRKEVIARIAKALATGRQAYWVCTLVEESEKLEAQAAQATAEILAQSLPDARVGLTHGRMKLAEKQQAMSAFKAHRLDVLVATTVIEVGVDVPNASLMIIENAERLGLAQLHQLRGRVGRGAQKSYCVLLYKPPLSATGRKRLSTLRDTNDGFVIAQADLELRGPGEVLGTRQTGLAEFRMADLVRDAKLIDLAQQRADELLAQSPMRARALIDRWAGAVAGYIHV